MVALYRHRDFNLGDTVLELLALLDLDIHPAIHAINSPTNNLELLVDVRKALVHLIKPLANFLKLCKHRGREFVDELVQMLEPLIYFLEPGINLRKPCIHRNCERFDTLVCLFESGIHRHRKFLNMLLDSVKPLV